MSAFYNNAWHHYAIELNIRKGEQHIHFDASISNNGEYNYKTGTFTLADGTERFYFATDNIQEKI